MDSSPQLDCGDFSYDYASPAYLIDLTDLDLQSIPQAAIKSARACLSKNPMEPSLFGEEDLLMHAAYRDESKLILRFHDPMTTHSDLAVILDANYNVIGSRRLSM